MYIFSINILCWGISQFKSTMCEELSPFVCFKLAPLELHLTPPSPCTGRNTGQLISASLFHSTSFTRLYHTSSQMYLLQAEDSQPKQFFLQNYFPTSDHPHHPCAISILLYFFRYRPTRTTKRIWGRCNTHWFHTDVPSIYKMMGGLGCRVSLGQDSVRRGTV